MTTTEQPRHLMGRDRVNVSDYPDAETLLRQLREANEHRDDMPGGFVWFFYRNPSDESFVLHAGVRGDVGALQWFDNDAERIFLPGGHNTEDVDYFSWFGHHFPMCPGTEVQVNQVFQAIGEYVRTGERPTCVEWAQLPTE